MLRVCNEVFFFFFEFNVIIFHSSQFEMFISSIQLNHTHGNFVLVIENTFTKMKKKKAVQIDVKRKQFKHQHKK